MSVPARLLISPRAAADLEELADFIARDNPARAASSVAELERQCRTVTAQPELYPARPDIAPQVRVAAYRRYLVIYRWLPESAVVRIERGLHGARHSQGQV